MDILTGKRLARRYWWQLLLRGVLALIFGILTFLWPGITLLVLVYLFAAWALLDGIFSAVAAFEERRVYPRWWALLIEGILGIVIGVLAFLWPGVTIVVFLSLIAIWTIITGIMEVSAAIMMRRATTGEWLLAIAGILSIIFGLFMFFEPRVFALAIVWLIAAFAIVFGIALIARAFALRSLFS